MPARMEYPKTILDYGRDPWVLKHKENYYYLGSGKKDDMLFIRRAKRLEELGGAQEERIFKPSKTENCQGLWAPELHYIDGSWYLYYAACDGQNKNHRMYVLRAKDIMGPYQELGKIADSDADYWAIDMTVFRCNRQLYAVWSGWEKEYQDSEFPQNLYIAKMKNPWTIDGKRRLLAWPEYNWEKSIQPILEGPAVLESEGRYFLFYSANASWEESYCIGLMELGGEDPMNPESWHKMTRPFLSKDQSGLAGPGHCCVSREGNLIKMYFHCKRDSQPGWEDRMAKVMELTINNLGRPDYQKA